MSHADGESPPMYFGGYPHGAYWSAERRESTDDEVDDFTVGGDVIRFMWDYSVKVPLWDANGLLPDEPEWLRTALGLSDPLIHELSEWGRAMNGLDADPRLRTEQAFRDLDRRARELVERLQQELGSRFTVRYKPW